MVVVTFVAEEAVADVVIAVVVVVLVGSITNYQKEKKFHSLNSSIVLFACSCCLGCSCCLTCSALACSCFGL